MHSSRISYIFGIIDLSSGCEKFEIKTVYDLDKNTKPYHEVRAYPQVLNLMLIHLNKPHHTSGMTVPNCANTQRFFSVFQNLFYENRVFDGTLPNPHLLSHWSHG
jgi:hypothetical protein